MPRYHFGFRHRLACPGLFFFFHLPSKLPLIITSIIAHFLLYEEHILISLEVKFLERATQTLRANSWRGDSDVTTNMIIKPIIARVLVIGTSFESLLESFNDRVTMMLNTPGLGRTTRRGTQLKSNNIASLEIPNYHISTRQLIITLMPPRKEEK